MIINSDSQGTTYIAPHIKTKFFVALPHISYFFTTPLFFHTISAAAATPRKPAARGRTGSVIYPEIKSNPTTIYSFLLAAGYLKIDKKDDIPDGNSICDIAIPNKEIFYVYEREILSARL